MRRIIDEGVGCGLALEGISAADVGEMSNTAKSGPDDAASDKTTHGAEGKLHAELAVNLIVKDVPRTVFDADT